MLIPLPWRRQNPGALDVSDTHATYAAMETYAASPTAYPGQLLYCAETDKMYRVKSDMSLELFSTTYTDVTGTTSDVGGWESH